MAEREFLGWEEPALPAAARRLADAHEAGDPRLGSAMVVFPVRRAARRLRELLVREAGGRGVLLPPPRMATVGGLPETLYDPQARPAGGLLRRRTWADALRSADRERVRAVFPRPPGDDDLEGWHRVGRVVSRLHREVGREGRTFSDVAAACAGRFSRRETRRWEALAGVQEVYAHRLRELGVGDPQLERRRALEEGRVRASEGVEAIWLVGVVELPGVARRMLGRLDVPVRALVHAPEELAETFDELGLVQPDRWAGRELDLPATMVVGRPPEQAEAALAAVSGEDDPLAPDAVTVGVPNAEVVPHLEQRLEEEGVPHRYAAGTELSETRPYRLLEAVADWLDGRRFADLAALVRHPDLADRLEVSLEEVDRYFREHLPQRTDRLPLATSRWSGALRRLMEQLDGELGLGRLDGKRPLARWADPLLGVLRRVYGEIDLDTSRPAHRRLVESCEAIASTAGAVAEIPAAASPEVPAPAAIRILMSELRGEQIPPEPVRPAVELLGWLELHLDDAPVLVLTGMDDGSVPGSAAGDAFLPDGLRSELGLPDDRSRHGRDAYLLAASLRPREEAHVILGRRSGEGDPLRPSRLLLQVPREELAGRVKHLFRQGEDRAAARPPRQALGGESERFTAPPEPVIRVEEVPDRLYVTDFATLLQDPYRFALERLRDLGSLDDADRELGGGAFGALAHRVLGRFGESPEAEVADVERIDDRLQALVEEERERQFGDDAFPAVRLQVEQLRQRLRDFARWQARRVEEGWRIVAVEVRPEGEGTPFEVDGEPVLLRGRIDRIDYHEGRDAWRLLDYKTGESADDPERAHRRGGRWVDLQLPLYRHLLSGIARREEVPSALGELRQPPGLGFVKLSREGVELAMAGWSEEELREADEAARAAVRVLRRGEFRHRPGEGISFRDDPLAPLFRSEGPVPTGAGGATDRGGGS